MRLSPRLTTPSTLALAAGLFIAVACTQERAGISSDSLSESSAVGPAAPLASPAPPTMALESVVATGADASGFALQRTRPQNNATSLPQSTSQSSTQTTPGSMLIRQGNASVQVHSLDTAIARVRQIASRVGGIVADVGMQTGANQVPSATIQLRIPSERFDETVNGLAPLGKVESVNVSVQDVGEEYVDVNARMENARRLEQRLIQLLANRTGKLADVLAVEHELARVREEIERYEGRLRYLRTRTAISTLAVTVHEPPPLVADRPGASPIRDALRQAWRNFVSVIAALIASTGVLVPLGVLTGILVLVGRRWLHAAKSAGAAGA
jgi:hypothetical protein